MFRKIKVLGLALLATALVSSCSSDSEEEKESLNGIGTDELVQNIASSSDAPIMAMSMDIGQLVDKAGVENLPLPMDFGQILTQVKSMGLTIDGELYVFAEGSSMEDMRAVIVGPISDAESFAKTLEQQMDVKAESEGGVKVAPISIPELPMGGTAMAFGEKAMMIVWTPGGMMEKSAVAELFNRAGDKKADGYLNTFLNSNSDMSMYMNYENMLAAVPSDMIALFDANAASQLEMVKPYYNDLISTMSMDFKNGEMTIAAETNYAEVNDMDFFNSEPLDDSFLSMLSPDGGVVAYMTLNMNLQGAIGFMEEMGVLNWDDINKQASGVNVEEIASVFTGEFAVSMYELPDNADEMFAFMSRKSKNMVDVDDNFRSLNDEEEVEEAAEEIEEAGEEMAEDMAASNSDDMKVIVVVGHNNKDMIMEMIKKNGAEGLMEEKNGMMVMKAEDAGTVMITDDKIIMVSTPALAERIAEEGQLTKPASGMNGNIMNGFVDLTTMPLAQFAEPSQRALIEQITGISLMGDSKRVEFSIKLKDVKRNSLAILVEESMKAGAM